MSGPLVDLHVRPTEQSSARPSTKPRPVLTGLIGDYHSSPDGVDSNLLILLHGLGDTQRPFDKLATSLRLPQSATLALRAPSRIPFLDEEAYQWWQSFDLLTGDPISRPDPTESLGLLIDLLEYLVDPGRGGWLPHEVHLFGFAQGGSCAAEAALAFARKHPPTPERPNASLGSLVVVSAPLLSLPTLDAKKRSACPVLLFLRAGEERKGRAQIGADVESAFRKGFGFVERAKAPSRLAMEAEAMPQGQDEWRPIIGFWAKHLCRRSAWEIAGRAEEGTVYEVSGDAPPR